MIGDETRRKVAKRRGGGVMTAGEEYDRMVEHLKSTCVTCVYGFPAAIGYSCGITRKVTSDVVVKCEAYRRARGA